ncbi:hypothetical protein GAB14E_0583 [Colwellia psychrerythraea]|uniref:Uncharacterized protein n=1 Tax=Colwellia psychrerythraea TaxID=28229 RepID=A0A099KJA4_COLPS|nr:hypothetical protein GAB14E_0583 [Colwellia psychrerythraea]
MFILRTKANLSLAELLPKQKPTIFNISAVNVVSAKFT